MLSVRRGRKPDYSLCNQTVTVYHQREQGIYEHSILSNAFLDFQKTRNTEKLGTKEVNSFLLVVPCERQLVFPGDKVLFGVGGEIKTREEWAALIPAKVSGLLIVQSVDVKYFGGEICHLEAGG